MSLTVRALNGDTAFLLTFRPPIAPLSSPGLFPGSFTILVDPWLTGPAQLLSPKFLKSEQKKSPCISSLAELPEEPDIVLITQDKPDHCHRDTLCQLPQKSNSIILATAPAAKKIRGWHHFEPSQVLALKDFSPAKDESIHRVPLPAFSPSGAPGEVAIALMSAKGDISGLHNAIGITYRPPCTVLSLHPGSYVDLPLSPPASPPASPLSPRLISANPKTIVPSPYNVREKTLSVIYSPHGVSYNIIRPYASSHLVAEAALPLTTLIHAFDRVDNPWYLGGNIATGFPGGIDIARNLFARAWISAHDAEKDSKGLAVIQVRTKRFTAGDIKNFLDERDVQRAASLDVVTLEPGQDFTIQSA